MTLPEFGVRLRKRRKAAGISLRQFATRVHYSPGWISRVENGAAPTDEFVRIVDDMLGAGGELIALARAEQPRAMILNPAQLPPTAARFSGRSDALEEIDRIHRTAPDDTPLIIAVDGPAGAGKTAFVLQVAHGLADQYSDGVLYADLQGWGLHSTPLEPGHVLERHLGALGIAAESIPPGTDERAALLRTVVAGRRILMVLDNARDAAQVRPLLPGTAGCATLITSRRRLTGLAVSAGAHRVELGPMPATESVALLRTVIGASRSDAEPTAVEALADRCGHLPLALRITAETLAARPHRAIAAAVEELEGQGRLDALMADDDPSLAVRTVLACSYRALDPEAARALRYLGIYPARSITAAVAAVLLDRELGQARRLLDSLAATHLLEETQGDRFRLHDLVRDFAVERAADEESADARAEVIRRLATWVMYAVDAAGFAIAPQRPIELLGEPPAAVPSFSDPDEARAWCDSIADLIVPLVRCAAEHHLAAAWEIPARLWNWLMLAKPWGLWIDSHTVGLAAATKAGNIAGRAWLAMNLGEAYRQSAHFDLARRYLLESQTLRRELGDVHGQAWVEACLGFTDVDEAEHEAAIAHFNYALDLFEQVGDRHGGYVVMASLAEALGHLGDAKAEAMFETALELTHGDEYAAGVLWARRAGVHQSQGDLGAALAALEESIALRKAAGDEWGAADALDRRGQILHETGRQEEARAAWTAARETFETLGDPRAEQLADRLSSP
ncbi:helix-turn-helix domain-containing protein [Streptomyces sp. NPDC059708]|uniref:helix-turn-helix domain-containing protein n=1 Tax=Streptomyces sp. NPDC059708 TaxID=3346916 RepID=UPI0036C0F016